ncbi:hypothetical protein AZE42_02885 [Rhizopogon vesiculosus]|uniref:WW domain-containing protein n=1 Tax=Rhizopogon vesiculosus TaxID=180088 RepID=A0A1J8PU08_9AGAM|nr:hypothetical protein AZE42_02885 [Rhizopogon vesiculosus]
MGLMPEFPEIHIVVQGPNDESDTCSMTSVRSRRTSSSGRTRLGPSLASSSSSPSLGGVYGASPSEGTALGSTSSSSSTRNTSRASLKITGLGPAIPIIASEVKRDDRRRCIPKSKKKTEITIDPGKNDFNDPQRYEDFAPQVHPDGALYFFDSERRIYTEANLSVKKEREIISHYAEQLVQQAEEKYGSPWATSSCVLVLEMISETSCGYYFVEPEKRCIMWLQPVSSDIMTRDLERVQSLAHIKYVMEAEYWTHCMLFPNNWSVTPEVVAELKQMVLHAVADSVASTTSVVPFDQEELAKILDLTDSLKDAVEEQFPHAKCIVARFMQDFALAKFFNFCGQPGARLNSDQSIFSKYKPRRSLFIKILSFCLFWAPCDYAKELDGIWVDRVINRVLWKQFIDKLSNDWSSLALYATVILNANVAFLTLQVDMLAKSFSFVSTMTSVGVVVLGLILVRQNQRKDQDSAEQASEFLGKMSHQVFGTEVLAVIFSLPYALLMWRSATPVNV